MSQLRLAIMGHFPSQNKPAGGIESVVANLVDCLVRRGGYEIHVVQHPRFARAGTFHFPGYTLYNLPIARPRIIPNTFRTQPLARQVLRQIGPDAVTSHHPSFAMAAQDLGIPVVHTIHGFPAKEFWTRRGLFVRAATLTEVYVERKMLRRIEHIIAISDYVIEAYRPRTKAIFYRVNNPIAHLFFEPSPPPQPGRFLLVGNLTTRKGVEVAIAAVARLKPRYPDIVLEIIGAEPDPVYSRRLRAQAAPLGDAVRFVGTRTQAGIKEALGRAQALVLTSYEEHAPMIVAEAMASARPVVATDVGALSGMVASGVTGFIVPPGDAAAVAEAMEKLLRDPDGATAMGREAARQAQSYHPEAVTDGYLRVLQRVMALAR
ncbi:MAG: glycosyltransferase family 1 protein [Chloroflexi bacterium]|nr:MAG: glycosyltransferase family 1 protein [Chloroflexota bacterium]